MTRRQKYAMAIVMFGPLVALTLWAGPVVAVFLWVFYLGGVWVLACLLNIFTRSVKKSRGEANCGYCGARLHRLTSTTYANTCASCGGQQWVQPPTHVKVVR